MHVKIIVDSTVDVNPDLKDNFQAVPLTVRFGDKEYQDGVTIDTHTFYERLVKSQELPTSSQPTPALFEDAFREAVEAGFEVVCITISSKLSGTYQSATIASQEFPGKVFVVDSRTATSGAGILAEYALGLAEKGVGAEEILKELLVQREKIRLYFMVDTLEYLKKGGRLSSTVALVGGMLNIKPVLCVDEEGEIKMLTTARGLKKAFAALSQEAEKFGGIDRSKPVMLGYTGTGRENLDKYLEEAGSLWPAGTAVTVVGTAIGVHVGPGAISICFFSKE